MPWSSEQCWIKLVIIYQFKVDNPVAAEMAVWDTTITFFTGSETMTIETETTRINISSKNTGHNYYSEQYPM